MRIVLSLSIVFGLFFGFGCEPEEEPAMALDGGLTVDIGVSMDQTVSADTAPPEADASGGCTSSEECPVMGQTCFMNDAGEGGQCAECLDNTFCPIERPFCSLDGQCSDSFDGICRDPLDCEDPVRARCHFIESGDIGSCVECLGNDDCVAPRTICATTGVCVASQSESGCADDEACGLLRQCVDEACVER